MKKVYLKERAELIERNKSQEFLTFSDDAIRHLPEPIKKYLYICGYTNNLVPFNANVQWAESFFKLSPDKAWGKLQTIQFNSVKPIARTSYMKFSNMPVFARDIYRDGYGEMKGKLFNLFRVVFDNTKEVAQSALITVFCEFMFIPGYTLLENVQWEHISNRSARATLTDNGIKVSGVFHFDEDGLFRHFETEDRYYAAGKNKYEKVRFSAFVESYKKQDDITIAEKVKIVWHLPDGDFEYFKGIVGRIDFNVLK